MHTACDVKLCALVAKLIIFHRLWKMFITNRGRNSNCLRLKIARDHHDDHHHYDQRATPRLPAVPADWPQPNYNNNSKCIEDAKLNVSPRSFAKNNTQSRAAERRAEESRIEKCVSLNFIYSRQFYAFKARLSTATSASGWGSIAMRKRRGRHIEINCGAEGAQARQLHLHSAIATPIENGMP